MSHRLWRKLESLGISQSQWSSRASSMAANSPVGSHSFCFSGSLMPFLLIRRCLGSNKAGESLSQVCGDSNVQVLDFPGGKVNFSSEMRFLSESSPERISCYRVLDDYGRIISNSSSQQVRKEVALKMYRDMVTLQTMDTIFYEAQRQGRISFYLTTIGEEAINIASAAALTIDDIVIPQEFAHHNFGTKYDSGKGRQMPVHYGCSRLNYFTVSSTIATQLPHAVGVAFALKMDKKNACAVVYFGDGGTSEGDFHAALNFAAVMEVPVIFFCRNNGWAISTPTTEQFRSDGAVIRGQAYGIRSIRIDGNDGLAVYNAVCAAREMAISECRPVLVEALTYRVGHHSTSDDSTKYRPMDEIEHWRTARDPVSRFRKWVEGNGWWSNEVELNLRSNVRKELLQAIQVAEQTEKPPLFELFTDVYDQVPLNLCEQEKSLRETIRKHPGDYPIDSLFRKKQLKGARQHPTMLYLSLQA
ncbi:2-oxoisovalerate dehydrogenase subunit alpha 2, mitochondrial-like isoform X2 [Dioscorea cayenensis subsp. rotundata]|uniref:3-methyl-2-oxobutanoate dehydrogenase (2-methylpropanoyl-transferring) n=1 Tax=Dioscorea cayennensis subsp. rotundata TaxID=55577 RepID=A0AB40BA21_DIOCR|nr:2-oxoisovalerate dehydrogenase subunit alpha 2, mitochondrial-like isoform X2 [Dioscorea cayenensis subsp. rotundata]